MGIRHWAYVIYRPILLAAVIGLLIAGLVVSNKIEKIVDTLKADNALQTELLEQQNRELRDLQKLGICLMEAHGVPLPEGVQNEIDCHQLAESFAPSPPPSQNQNSNTPAPSVPPAEGGGGGTPEEPDEPSFIEMLIAPITNLLKV